MPYTFHYLHLVPVELSPGTKDFYYESFHKLRGNLLCGKWYCPRVLINGYYKEIHVEHMALCSTEHKATEQNDVELWGP